MTAMGFRSCSKRFLDNQNYPRGFRKCGDYSIAEADILTTLGTVLVGLSKGELAPETEEEKRFLLVLKGDKLPESKVEKTWLKYCKLTNSPRRFYTVFSKCKGADSDNDLAEEGAMDYEADE